MEALEDRILNYITNHDVGGLHDIAIAKDLSANSAKVVAALRKLRSEGRIVAADRQIQTTDGVTTLDGIRVV